MTEAKGPSYQFFNMLFAPLKLLANIYLEVIGDDIKKEGARCLNAILMLGVGFFFIFNTILMLNALGVFLINNFLNNWVWSLLSVLGLQLVLSVLFFIFAKASLSGPYFARTKKMLDKAYKEFK